jgi:hypothetical protein
MCIRFIGDQLLTPMFGHGDDEWIVQQRQRLIGNIGHIPPADRLLRDRLIKQGQKPGRFHQRHLEVNAAATVAVERPAEKPLLIVFRRAIGFDGRTEQRAIKTTRNRQYRIPNRLRLQSSHRQVVPQPVFGINGESRGCRNATLSPGGGCHQQVDQLLRRPALIDKTRCQVIE